MTTMHLYEIRELRDALDEALAATDGEVTPEIEAQLSAIDGKADEKIERVALYIREQTAQAEAINAEAERLQARATAKLNAAKSLKGYLEREMMRLGKTKVNGLLATVAIQANGPRVVGEVAPETLVEWESFASPFVRYTEKYELNRQAVLLAYKNGQPIPDGLSVEQTASLRIR